MLHQAQDNDAARNDSLESSTCTDPFSPIDHLSIGSVDDDLAPPAYDHTDGEIHNDQNGMTTNARIADDGRVRIRIHQTDSRLSKIFDPALRRQFPSPQDSGSTTPHKLLSESHDKEELQSPPPAPPPLNIVVQVVGSRGDVQPFIALARVLKQTYGHRVRLATHPCFKTFVEENDVEFFSIGGDPSRLMAFMVKNPGLMPGLHSLLGGDVGQRRKDVAEYLEGCWRSCYQTGDGVSLAASVNDLVESSPTGSALESTTRPFVADCIIANPPSFAHIHCAEKLGVPLHIMFTMPYTPTQDFPHPLANIQSSNVDPRMTNYISYAMIEVLVWQGLGDVLNRLRQNLGLDPISPIWAPGLLQRLKVPHTYCWSPALIPKPSDWESHISVSGFSVLNSLSDYTPPPALQAFLDAGPPPCYIGFGSIVLDNPTAMTEIVFEAVRKTGQRVLLSKGWGGMGTGESHIPVPDDVFMISNVPHDWLFKHVSCVVHHGGAGTTAAGIAAGRPTVVVPFFGDQHFWGAVVARAGAGPDPIPHKQLTSEKLAKAIRFCLTPESPERSQELASKIAREQGSDSAAQSFHRHLDVDTLRCSLVPSRAACWTIKSTKARVSAFAACTLIDAQLLSFDDLQIYRPQEYTIDEGPPDPLSGSALAVLGSFGGMITGLASIPSETLRALRNPSRAGERHSEIPLHSSTELSQIRNGRETLSPLTSPDHCRKSLDAQSLPDNASRSGYRGREESSFAERDDKMRRTGLQVSKGAGRFIKAGLLAPIEFTEGLTKGFHNAPKLWGDDTVRPQYQVDDFKSGVKATGKELGFGLYDGITGLVTQPWEGAKKQGTGGFLKGLGKGIGGFATKPSAAICGVLGYTMKGSQKEVQKADGRNARHYIGAARVAQGYEEWLRSSDTEKQDVIYQWKLI